MRIFYLMLMLLLSNFALSATVDGNLKVGSASTLGFNSQGSFDINVTKGDAVRISNLNSVVISGSVSTSDKTASDDVCYYATTAQYTVDMDSTNPPAANGRFQLILSTDSSKNVPYELDWDDNKDGIVEVTFTKNSDLAYTYSSNNRTSTSCQTTGGTNARITVIVRNASYNSMSTGLYTDTVLITLKAK